MIANYKAFHTVHNL